jgi:predicted ATP-grasp superfamily ATP-dependent carboligase
MDKMELARVARAHDIETPLTVCCSSIEELESHVPALGFPVVVKPRFAYQWRAKGAWQTVGARKAFLVRDADQLRSEYRQLSAISPEILVQEFISGEDTDIVVCAGYVNDRHDLVAYFTARKLRQSPPLFGTGCAVEATDVPAIIPITRSLLQACRYTGLAEVEFKHDQSSGTYSLIEVNPRHWDQHQLGTLAGINLSWVAYQEMTGRSAKPQAPIYRTGTQYKWIAEPEVLRLLMRNAYTRSQVNVDASLRSKLAGCLSAVRTCYSEAGFLLKGRKIFATFHARDPVPGLLLCLRTLRDLGGMVIRRVVRAASVSTAYSR